MPVTTAKKGKKFRVVEAATGAIALNAAGTALDGGGHDSYDQALAQARAVNASLRRQGKIKTSELKHEIVTRQLAVYVDDPEDSKNPDGRGFAPSKQPRQIVYSCDAYGYPVDGYYGSGPGVGTVGLPQRTRDNEVHPGKNPIIPDYGIDLAHLAEEPWWRELYKAMEAASPAKPLLVLLVRHGEAEEPREDEVDDKRELTKEGAKKLEKAFKGLGRLGVTVDRVLTSPTKRTQETADLLSKELGDGSYRVEQGLHHADFDPESVCRAIDAAPKGSTLAIVGHHEWLGPFTDFLVHGTKVKTVPANSHGIKYGFGSAGRVEFEGQRMPGKGNLTSLFSPRSLRKLAK